MVIEYISESSIVLNQFIFMSKNNTQWNPGDIAICIDNSSSSMAKIPCPLRLGGEYNVNKVSKCPTCKILLLDVGFNPPSDMPAQFCTTCKKSHVITDIWYFRATRFVKKNDNEKSETFIEDLLKQPELL